MICMYNQDTMTNIILLGTAALGGKQQNKEGVVKEENEQNTADLKM